MEDKKIFCSNCYYGNNPGENICEVCGSPIGMVGPPIMERLFTGSLHYQAADRPTKLIVVIGVWFMFLPAILTLSYYTFNFFVDGQIISAAVMGVFNLFFIAVVIKTTKNYIKGKSIEQNCVEDDEE